MTGCLSVAVPSIKMTSSRSAYNANLMANILKPIQSLLWFFHETSVIIFSYQWTCSKYQKSIKQKKNSIQKLNMISIDPYMKKRKFLLYSENIRKMSFFFLLESIYRNKERSSIIKHMQKIPTFAHTTNYFPVPVLYTYLKCEKVVLCMLGSSLYVHSWYIIYDTIHSWVVDKAEKLFFFFPSSFYCWVHCNVLFFLLSAVDIVWTRVWTLPVRILYGFPFFFYFL
jgi:hypothetical protein